MYIVDHFSQQLSGAMKLSTWAQYGTRALLDLVLHRKEGPVLLRDIAERQQIPPGVSSAIERLPYRWGYSSEHPRCQKRSFINYG